jgi:hypothetical protein
MASKAAVRLMSFEALCASSQISSHLPHVEIFTDGGCEPNPGPGGYCVVFLHPKKRTEACGGFRLTTNNRMEIHAAIKGLEMLKQPGKLTLYSDSQYRRNPERVRRKWEKAFEITREVYSAAKLDESPREPDITLRRNFIPKELSPELPRSDGPVAGRDAGAPSVQIW